MIKNFLEKMKQTANNFILNRLGTEWKNVQDQGLNAAKQLLDIFTLAHDERINLGVKTAAFSDFSREEVNFIKTFMLDYINQYRNSDQAKVSPKTKEAQEYHDDMLDLQTKINQLNDQNYSNMLFNGNQIKQMSLWFDLWLHDQNQKYFVFRSWNIHIVEALKKKAAFRTRQESNNDFMSAWSRFGLGLITFRGFFSTFIEICTTIIFPFMGKAMGLLGVLISAPAYILEPLFETKEENASTSNQNPSTESWLDCIDNTLTSLYERFSEFFSRLTNVGSFIQSASDALIHEDEENERDEANQTEVEESTSQSRRPTSSVFFSTQGQGYSQNKDGRNENNLPPSSTAEDSSKGQSWLSKFSSKKFGF